MKQINVEDIINELKTNHNHSWYQELKERNKNNLNSIALKYRGTKITYARMFEKMNEYAKVLKNNGVKYGDEIPVTISNTPEFIYLVGAASIVGAKINIFSPEFDKEYIEEIIKDTKSEVVFVGEKEFIDMYPVLSKINKKIIYIPLYNSLPKHFNNSDPYYQITKNFYKTDSNTIEKLKNSLSLCTDINQELENSQNIYNYENVSNIDDEFTITYSSGSTNSSRPKAIVHSNNSYIFMGRYHDPEVSGIPTMKNNTTLAMIPTHSNTNLTSSISDTLMEGGIVALEPIYDKDYFIYSMEINKPSLVIATRSFWLNAMKQYYNNPSLKDIKLKSVFVPTSVGEPLEKNEEKALNKWLKKVRAGVDVIPSPTSFITMSVAGGDCEHGGIFLILFRALQSKKPSHIFMDVPHGMTPYSMVETKVLNEDGDYCKPFEFGTIVANSPCTMVKYKNNEQATENFYITDKYGKKWASCNAYGYLDNQGNVYMKGRIGEKIESIPPFVVADQILKDTQNILSCEVIKYEDNDGKAKYIAYIEPMYDKKININKLLYSSYQRCVSKFDEEFCKDIYFVFVPNNISFPLTGCGKRNNKKLKELGIPSNAINYGRNISLELKK